jgi:hypothetical protein
MTRRTRDFIDSLVPLDPGRARGARGGMSKFNARKVVVDGHSFDSAAEGRRYATLAALERSGKIAGLELQPRFDCIVAGVKICSYIGDFRYRRDGAVVVRFGSRSGSNHRTFANTTRVA